MWQEEGFRGFMRGNGINCLRIVPYRCVFCFGFHSCGSLKWLLQRRSVHDVRTAEEVVHGVRNEGA